MRARDIKKKALASAAPGNLILQVKQDLYCKKVKYCSFTLNAIYYLLSYLTNKNSGLSLWARYWDWMLVQIHLVGL